MIGIIAAVLVLGGWNEIHRYRPRQERRRGILVASCIRFEQVSPGVWQRSLGCLSKGDKNVTKALADALLIAEYGREQVPYSRIDFGDGMDSKRRPRKWYYVAKRGHGKWSRWQVVDITGRNVLGDFASEVAARGLCERLNVMASRRKVVIGGRSHYSGDGIGANGL